MLTLPGSSWAVSISLPSARRVPDMSGKYSDRCGRSQHERLLAMHETPASRTSSLISVPGARHVLPPCERSLWKSWK